MPKEKHIADLHNSIPVVAGSDAEESEERHAEVTEVSVLAESFAVKHRRAFCTHRNSEMPTTY